MKKCSFVFASILLALPPLAAQVSNPSIVPRATAPTACTTLPLYVLTTNGDLYGDNGSGVCKVLSTPTSALSGSGTATHLPIWSAGSTLGDSPATFDGTTFVFPNPFSVQAHSAFGVGSAVDTIPTFYSSYYAPGPAMAVFDETNTSAAGEHGVLSQVIWNPSTTATDGQTILGMGGSVWVNADSQATADLQLVGGVFDAESNGNTTAVGGLNAIELTSLSNGTNTVSAQELINGDLENVSGGTTTTMILNYETMVNPGTATTMIGDDRQLTNSGATSTLTGAVFGLHNTGTVSGDVNAVLGSYGQSAGNPTDYLGYVSTVQISGGTFSGLGIAHFVADGETAITATGTHAIQNYIGFDFEAVTAPAHVINNEYGVLIADVTQGDNNWSIKAGLGLAELDGTVKLGGITGHGTAGVVGIDTSGNLSAEAAPACASCVVASSPGAGIARFAGSTQTVTSAELSGDCTTSGSNAVTCLKTNNVAFTSAATTAIGTSGATIPLLSTANTWTLAQTFSALAQFSLGENLATGQVLSWNADTGISRDSGGVIDVGNGTAGSTTGTIQGGAFHVGTGANGIFTSTPELRSDMAYSFSASTNASSTQDTSLNRAAAGVIGIGLGGSTASTGGSLRAASFQSGGTKFTTSGCSVSSTTGGATAGIFTLGANTCTVVITMNGATGLTAPNGWSCAAHDRTTVADLVGGESSSTTTTASITIPVTTGSTDVISFACTAF